jgi:hypothetical protein
MQVINRTAITTSAPSATSTGRSRKKPTQDLKTFREWFRIDVLSVVVDVADDDIEGVEL